jgi:hypothetical protein
MSKSKLHPYLTNGRQSDQSVFQIGSAALLSTGPGLHRIGTRGVLEDGRVFRYARNTGAAAIVAGQLLQMPDQAADHIDLAVNTALVGDETITVTLGTATAVTVNEFAGGYAITNSGTTGAGLTLPIASHPAAAALGTCVLTLDGPVPVLFNADTTVTLSKNPWADVIISGANQDHLAVGVANTLVPVGNSVAQYFWCQTWGTCGVWQDDTTANGSAMASGTTAGQIEITGGTDQIVGVNLEVGVADDYTPVFLTIAP